MIPRRILAFALLLAIPACSPLARSNRGVADSASAGGALPQTALVSPQEAGPTAGHVDPPGAAPHSHSNQIYGEPGDPTRPARTIEIVMDETDDGRMIFHPSSVQARAGEQVLFKIRNEGQLDHEFVLATHEANLKHGIEMQKNPDMEHDDPNAVRLASGAAGDILWKFTNSGEFEFACLVPGHREAGMYGTVIAAN